MKMLLTSAGISNRKIKDALVDLLGKPVEEASALFIPTAIYALRDGPQLSQQVITGLIGDPFCQLGWKSLGILELTALPTVKQDRWVDAVMNTDALLVGGGDCQYLTYWMQQSGLAKLLPDMLNKTVYVGLSAGSMIMTSYGTTYNGHTLPEDSDKSLGFLNFALHAHLDYPTFPDNSYDNLQKLSATLPMSSYAIDDQTAIKITGEKIEVVSEGRWKFFEH